mmetsp:Transcript_31373/g.46273  ORF Transcript_31373/g.46273 Transcript_31373/m.46273 type:complete len:155 (-) Transcript_31373:293-757(-)
METRKPIQKTTPVTIKELTETMLCHQPPMLQDDMKLISGSRSHPVWRESVLEWCNSLVDSIEADRELVHTAFDIFDRYLAVQDDLSKTFLLSDKKTYITAVLSSMLLAARLFSVQPYLPLEDILGEDDADIVAIQDIRETAKDIYKSLTWDDRS